MEDFDTKQYEQACNNIFPGLQMFVRDTILDDEVEKMYIVGKIIKEPAFCDASCRVGGLVTSHRFAILSNRYVDFGPAEHRTNWGLYVCKRNSYFKILDVFKINDKTQISLLHLNEKFKLFENNTSNVEKDIIKMSRERFQNKYNMSPIPELATKEWLQRLLSPVGINEQQNKYFPLDGEPLKKDDPNILESIKSMDSIIEKLVKVKEEWNSAHPNST
jgi:hypothetical protein